MYLSTKYSCPALPTSIVNLDFMKKFTLQSPLVIVRFTEMSFYTFRYHHSITVSDLYRLWDTVDVLDQCTFYLVGTTAVSQCPTCIDCGTLDVLDQCTFYLVGTTAVSQCPTCIDCGTLWMCWTSVHSIL